MLKSLAHAAAETGLPLPTPTGSTAVALSHPAWVRVPQVLAKTEPRCEMALVSPAEVKMESEKAAGVSEAVIASTSALNSPRSMAMTESSRSWRPDEWVVELP